MSFNFPKGPLDNYYEWLYEREREAGTAPPTPTKFRKRGEPSSGLNLEPVYSAVAFLVTTVSSKEAATNMSNKDAASQIIAAANKAISEYIDGDDICPPWPWPGPPPWLSIVASELTLVANSLQEGSLRTNILQVAGQVLDRAQALGTGAVGAAARTARTRAA
jgi:hypothetical protein